MPPWLCGLISWSFNTLLPSWSGDPAAVYQAQLLEGWLDATHTHLVASPAVRAAVRHHQSALLLFAGAGDLDRRAQVGLHDTNARLVGWTQ